MFLGMGRGDEGDFETGRRGIKPEFEHVMVTLPRTWSPLLTRELIYTGATRARRQMTMVGDREILEQALAQTVKRSSGLKGALWG